jgi:hypothetical protein
LSGRHGRSRDNSKSRYNIETAPLEEEEVAKSLGSSIVSGGAKVSGTCCSAGGDPAEEVTDERMTMAVPDARERK